MAGCAIQRHANFVRILRVELIDDRMTLHWMPEPVFDGKHRNLREVVFRQLHLPIEYGDHVLFLEPLRPCIRAMALEAQRVRIGRAQQVQVFASVRFMADRAPLLENRLMQVSFFALVRDVGVATEADIHGVRLGQSRLRAGVRIVTVGAVAGCSRVGDLGAVNLLGLLVVAGDAQRLGVRLR